MLNQQPKRLGEVLVESGVISEWQLQDALERKRGSGCRLGSMLVQMNLANEEQICQAVAAQQGIPVVDLNSVAPEPQALARVPAELALKHCMVPVKLRDNRLLLVMADPLDIAGHDAAWRASKCAIVDRAIARESDVLAALHDYYGGSLSISQSWLRGLAATEDVTVLADALPARPAVSDAEFDVPDAINAVLGGAAAVGATHVHFEPGTRTTDIRYRVDGHLRHAARVPGTVHAALVGRLRSLFHVDPNQPSSCQEGHASLQLGQHQVGLRLSLVPSVHGETAVVRVLDPRRFQRQIGDLGFTEAEMAQVAHLLTLPNGLIVVVGPEDAGTTTTLCALFNHLRQESLGLVAIENPVETLFPGVTQIEINERAGVSWPDALRSALRLDPDVLMLSDLPDVETARLALHAAMNGQLVLAALRAETAAAGIALLLDMGLEPYLLASTLRAAIGQRLVRRVCPECQIPDRPDPRWLDRLEITPADLKGAHLVRGQGCGTCSGTGFVGRLGVFETITARRALRELIAAGASALEVARAAHELGMSSLREDALAKVFSGVTTLAEAATAVPSLE